MKSAVVDFVTPEEIHEAIVRFVMQKHKLSYQYVVDGQADSCVSFRMIENNTGMQIEAACSVYPKSKEPVVIREEAPSDG